MFIKWFEESECVAVKFIFSRFSEDRLEPFNRAYEFYSTMNKVNSPHLKHCLATYREDDDSNASAFLFPWSHSTLDEFLRDKSEQYDEPEMHNWIFTQIKGIAEAFDQWNQVYEENGQIFRYGNLRPRKVHWVPKTSESNLGYLVLTSTGLAKVYEKHTSLTYESTSRGLASDLYAAPEESFNPSRKPILQSYDMWSIGCICMEIIIWLMYGESEVSRFHHGEPLPNRVEIRLPFVKHPYFRLHEPNKRLLERFYTRKWFFASKLTLHPRVSRWAEYIRMDDRCSSGTAIRELLDLVERRLLVLDMSKRCSSKELANSMIMICEKLGADRLDIRDASYKAGPPEKISIWYQGWRSLSNNAPRMQVSIITTNSCFYPSLYPDRQ